MLLISGALLIGSVDSVFFMKRLSSKPGKLCWVGLKKEVNFKLDWNESFWKLITFNKSGIVTEFGIGFLNTFSKSNKSLLGLFGAFLKFVSNDLLLFVLLTGVKLIGLIKLFAVFVVVVEVKLSPNKSSSIEFFCAGLIVGDVLNTGVDGIGVIPKSSKSTRPLLTAGFCSAGCDTKSEKSLSISNKLVCYCFFEQNMSYYLDFSFSSE